MGSTRGFVAVLSGPLGRTGTEENFKKGVGW